MFLLPGHGTAELVPRNTTFSKNASCVDEEDDEKIFINCYKFTSEALVIYYEAANEGQEEFT